eukprot:5693356-Prymnesium_polylepis.1
MEVARARKASTRGHRTTGTLYAGRTDHRTSRHISPDQSVRHKQVACNRDACPQSARSFMHPPEHSRVCSDRRQGRVRRHGTASARVRRLHPYNPGTTIRGAAPSALSLALAHVVEGRRHRPLRRRRPRRRRLA